MLCDGVVSEFGVKGVNTVEIQRIERIKTEQKLHEEVDPGLFKTVHLLKGR